MNVYIIPNTGERMYDGSIVTIATYPNIKWIAHYGWYVVNHQTYCGWYFKSIPSNITLSINSIDPSGIHVIDTRPKPDDPSVYTKFTIKDKEMLDSAFISVNNLAQRDQLPISEIPNGKLVRVNDTGEGRPGYYAWNAIAEQWEESFHITGTVYDETLEL